MFLLWFLLVLLWCCCFIVIPKKTGLVICFVRIFIHIYTHVSMTDECETADDDDDKRCDDDEYLNCHLSIELRAGVNVYLWCGS